jgi:hypothetical protein
LGFLFGIVAAASNGNDQAGSNKQQVSGVNKIKFYVGYSNSNQNLPTPGEQYWKDAGYELNTDNDNVFAQNYCLPSNVPSGTLIEFAIHIEDKAGNYTANGEGTKYSTFIGDNKDSKAPIVNIKASSPFDSPYQQLIWLDMNLYDVGNSGGQSDAVGIKDVKYEVNFNSYGPAALAQINQLKAQGVEAQTVTSPQTLTQTSSSTTTQPTPTKVIDLTDKTQSNIPTAQQSPEQQAQNQTTQGQTATQTQLQPQSFQSYSQIQCNRNCNQTNKNQTNLTPELILPCTDRNLCTNPGWEIQYTLRVTATDNNNNSKSYFHNLKYKPIARSNQQGVDLQAVLWKALQDRGAQENKYETIVAATAILAWDFLIADDARACWNEDWNNWQKYLGCVMTLLNIVAFAKVLGVLAKMAKVAPALKVANQVDKARDVYKAVDSGEDATTAYERIVKGVTDCFVSSPSLINKLLGGINASAGVCLGWIDNINMTHIVDRHAWNSAFAGVSKFAKGEDLLNLVKTFNSKTPINSFVQHGRTKKIVETGRTIGIDSSGNATSKMFIVVNNSDGGVVTSFPATLEYFNSIIPR